MKIYQFTITRTYPAETEEEARKIFIEELASDIYSYSYDPSDWTCKELPRNEQTEWMYRTFKQLKPRKGLSK